MLKLISFVHRVPSLTRADFVAHWQHHGALVCRFAPVLGIRRYAQNVPLEDAAAQEALRAGRGLAAIDCDGSASLWWDDMASHLAVRKTPEGAEALNRLIEDERTFVDIARSQFWYAEETMVLSEENV